LYISRLAVSPERMKANREDSAIKISARRRDTPSSTSCECDTHLSLNAYRDVAVNAKNTTIISIAMVNPKRVHVVRSDKCRIPPPSSHQLLAVEAARKCNSG
jgi:hypothetical protein